MAKVQEKASYWSVSFKSSHDSVEVKANTSADADKKGVALAKQQKGKTGDPISDKIKKLAESQGLASQILANDEAKVKVPSFVDKSISIWAKKEAKKFEDLILAGKKMNQVPITDAEWDDLNSGPNADDIRYYVIDKMMASFGDELKKRAK